MWTRERLTVLARTLAVASITAITFLAFFLRDYLLMRADHGGHVLDVFYTGMVVPALVVNVLLIPFGTALVPYFVRIGALDHGLHALPEVLRVALRLSAWLAVAALILALVFDGYAAWIAPGFDANKLSEVHEVLVVGVIIMTIGGSVIVLNSALNAAGRQMLTAVAQLAVAVVAIAVVTAFYPVFGVMAAVTGMLAGQVVNLAILVLYIRRRKNACPTSGVSPAAGLSWRELATQYLPLIGAALLAGLTLPVTNALAATLPSGSVALFGFGYKVILFITGIIATALTAVVVPFFVTRFDASREQAGRDAAFFLWIITLATLPIVMATYEWADEAMDAMLPDRIRAAGGAIEMARVIKFGIVQLPFFSVSVVLTRYLVACRRSAHVLLAALLSVAVLALTGALLRGHFGIAGIAVATTLSVGVMSLYLLLVLYRVGQISPSHLVSTLVFWMLFVTLSVCMHYASYTGIVISLFAITLLLASNRDAIRPWLKWSTA